MKSRFSTKVRQRPDFRSAAIIASSLFFILAILVLLATGARAQTTYPRVGLSVSPDSYVGTITVVPGEEFTLYACVFGPAPGEPVDQPFTSLSWVIHQVCCGAEVDISEFDFNPDLQHVGHPLVGVQSTAEICYERDAIVSHDCEGNNALFMGMAVTIDADGEPTPNEGSRWGSIKAIYR